MRKSILTILCAICAAAILGTPMPKESRLLPILHNGPTLAPLKAGMERSSTEVTKYVLIDEHFDNVNEGSEASPAETPLMNRDDFLAGRGIDQNIIGGGSWTSSNAYAAGGAVAIISPNQMTSGYINTPPADYSGEITVSFKAKPLENNGETKSYVSVRPYFGDFRLLNEAHYSEITPTDFNLYSADENWTEVEIKFNNYTSNTDGIITIQCNLGSAVLIDDLKITTAPTFVADPVLKPAEFGTNTITACWYPVRRAFNYHLHLYKKILVGDGDAEYEEDFDDILPDGSNLPEGWKFNMEELNISENGGYDGTAGIMLRNGETLETIKNGARYRNASVWLKSYYPSKEAADADVDALICIDVYRDGTWYPFAGYYMCMLTDEPAEDDMLTLAEMYWTDFADRYESIRIRIKDSNCPEAYVVADHFYIETGQPIAYELIPDKDGNEYTLVEDTQFEIKFENSDKYYPYHGLKQECDYAYSLRSHYLYERSGEVFADLAGVYTPVVAKPEDNGSGFKASWEPVYAADSYRIDYYGVRSLKKDTESCIVFEEKFDNTECPTTDPLYPTELANTEISDLSGHSDMPGWGGRNNVYVNGMMGFSGGYMITPLLNLPNAETATVRIVYYSTPYDVLMMTDAEGRMYFNECTGSSDMNRTEAEFTVPVGKKPCEFTLRSDYGLPILIDEFQVLQDAKAGNKVFTYLGSVFEDSPSAEHSFSGLDTTGFTGFGYSVTALRQSPLGVLFSSPSNYRFVGTPQMFDGVSEIGTVAAEVRIPAVEGYYTLDGIRRTAPLKGINIVRMTDGSVKKIIVK